MHLVCPEASRRVKASLGSLLRTLSLQASAPKANLCRVRAGPKRARAAAPAVPSGKRRFPGPEQSSKTPSPYASCLVDTDPQCNATESFGIRAESLVEEGKFTLADAYLKKRSATDIELDFGERFAGRLTLLAGNRGLSSVPLKLESELQIAIADGVRTTLDADEMRSEQRLRLRRSLDTLRGKRDVVIVDTPPSLDFLMISALVAADWFIIPVFPSGYDLKGLELLMRTVAKVRYFTAVLDDAYEQL